MYFDKTKQLFYNVLPQNHLGVSNFNALSDEELAEHGIIPVVDNKPEHNPNTQELVKGSFNEETGVREWIVQDFDRDALKAEKRLQLSDSYSRYLKDTSDAEVLADTYKHLPDVALIAKRFEKWRMSVRKDYLDRLNSIDVAVGKAPLEEVPLDFSNHTVPTVNVKQLMGIIGI